MPSRGKPRPEPLIRQSYGLAAKETPADLIHLCTTHFQSVAAHTVLGLSKSFAYQSWQLSILQNRWFLLEKFRRTIPRSNPTATWSSFCISLPLFFVTKGFYWKDLLLKERFSTPSMYSQLLPCEKSGPPWKQSPQTFRLQLWSRYRGLVLKWRVKHRSPGLITE